MEEWKSGRVEEWKSGRVEEWKSGNVTALKIKNELPRPCDSVYTHLPDITMMLAHYKPAKVWRLTGHKDAILFFERSAKFGSLRCPFLGFPASFELLNNFFTALFSTDLAPSRGRIDRNCVHIFLL